jgi:hypothetical protein
MAAHQGERYTKTGSCNQILITAPEISILSFYLTVTDCCGA